MKEISLILIGGGCSCVEIIDLIDDINKIEKKQFIKIIGILDDNKFANKKINGINVIGKLKDVKKFKKEKFFVNIFHKDNRFIRPKLIKKLNLNLSKFFSIIHPYNLVGKSAKIGVGVSIYPGCNIFSNSKIGNFCNIMPNASMAPNSIIGDNCFIGKDVLIGGGSRIRKNVFISNGTTVLENIHINEGNRIIPNSMINRSIKEKKMIIGGSPSKILFKEKI
jgi:UDP-3-O-[3-hydroxymyristoyl] glucosamine N-acyltransferase